LAQNDIKRVLAYSTISQLGYMFVAVGVGAFSAAIFHLFTQAFIKASLFLNAGSIIHGLKGEQDIRKMGGLKRYFPVTYWTYLIAALAISGAPLTAGFFSKDQILWQAFASANGLIWFWLLAWVTAGLTAFYMFRQFFMVFHGECKVETPLRPHIHESPRVMTVPLILLALGSVFAGWLGAPDYMWGSLWDHWLTPFFGASGEIQGESVSEEALLTLLTLGISALGFFLAYLCYYREGKLSERLSSWAGGGPYRLLLNKYHVDEIYDSMLVRPFTRTATWCAEVMDLAVIDRIVNDVADRVRASSLFWRQLQTGNVQHYLLGFLVGAVLILAYYLYQ
jgi:NADH-quinone oxidoreductase subunit L